MKLRNKKTGEIVTLDSDHEDSLADFGGKILIESKGIEFPYESLAALNKDWEDYKPAEPLIKDEKIRKAVRAWADANSLKWAAYSADGKFYDKTTDYVITFKTYANRSDIPECKLLPIDELCGEEE